MTTFNLKQQIHIAALKAASEIEWGLKPESYAVAMRAAFDATGLPAADYEYFRHIVTETRGRLNALANTKSHSEFAGPTSDPLKVPKPVAPVEAPPVVPAAT